MVNQMEVDAGDKAGPAPTIRRNLPSFAGRGLQIGLLDTHAWLSRPQLATTMLFRIDGRHNPRRRHFVLGYHSPAEHEMINPSTAELAARQPRPPAR